MALQNIGWWFLPKIFSNIDVEEPDDGNIQIAETVLLQCVEETI